MSAHDIVVPFSVLLNPVIMATDVSIEPSLLVSCTVMCSPSSDTVLSPDEVMKVLPFFSIDVDHINHPVLVTQVRVVTLQIAITLSFGYKYTVGHRQK